ncbi:MAG: MerR family transcriptional regulator [Polyangiales bacterium]
MSLQLPQKIYFRIGEVARLLAVAPHVIRFWETEFKSLRPQKSSTGQRVYTRRDVERLATIRRLLKEERYTIEGARKYLREKGIEADDRAASTASVDRPAALRSALLTARARLVTALEDLTRSA